MSPTDQPAATAAADPFARLVTSEAAFRMEVLHPVTGQVMRDAEGKSAYVDIYSSTSKAAETFKKRQFEQLQRTRGRRAATESYEAAQARNAEFLVSITAGWYLPVDLDGNPIDLPFNAGNAKRAYETPALSWLTKQVDGAAGDDANFIGTSSTT